MGWIGVKVLLGLLLFGVAISTMASVSAYLIDCPRIYPDEIEDFSLWVSSAQNTVAKSSNGTLYAMTVDPEQLEYFMRLYKSTDGYNWTYVHTFKGYVTDACMAINSTGVLHIITKEEAKYFSYIAFNLSTETNTTYWKNCIGDGTGTLNAAYGPRMEINSTDGIRAGLYNNYSNGGSLQGIYFLNDSAPFTYMAIPGTTNMKRASMTIAENNSMYFGAHRSNGNIGFWCWDDANGTLIDLGTVNVGGTSTACYDIFVNNTTIAATVSGNPDFVFSDLPDISWNGINLISNVFPSFFHMNGSRLEFTQGRSWGSYGAKSFNTSYISDGSLIEIRNITVIGPEEEPYDMNYHFSIRRNRFHEPDFWSSTVDMKCYVNYDAEWYGHEAWVQLYPDVAPSFMNSTVDGLYNESYLVNIDPKDLNPQDNVTSILQNTNTENNWLDYTGGVLSGTVGETDYGNTTVWIKISFDDGTTNFTYNFTFNSERIQLLYTTTLPHGYLNVHYRGTIRVVDNTTWYVVTNAGWASVDNTTGEITGYPSSRGNFWFHIYLEDINSNNTDDWNITVVIGIRPGDASTQITEIVVPILIAVVGLVITIAVLYGVFGSLGSTFNRFGKS